MALDLKRKLARLGAPAAPAAPPASPTTSAPPFAPPVAPFDLERIARIARMRELIERMESRERIAVRAAGPRTGAPPSVPLPGEVEDTPHGPLHRISQLLQPQHCHGRIPIAGALEVPSAIAAALALDPALAGIDLRRMLFLDTETTGLSGGTGTLPFLIGMAWFEDESLRVEQLFLRRPGEERPLLARLAERIAASSCLVTYNGKSFDWPLLRTRAVMNRVAVPTPAVHLDLLHCARRVFARRLGQVRLVQIETEILGMRRERDVDGAEIPHLYWEFVRGAESSTMAPVIEHNANDLIALAGLLAVLGERWQDALPTHEPEDRLGIARIALRHGDLDRATRFAEAAARGGGAPDVTVDALLVATHAARARDRHDEVL
nr:ribonuclease H-like domain-containing protein [Myxococcota bacterium]